MKRTLGTDIIIIIIIIISEYMNAMTRDSEAKASLQLNN